MITFPGVVQDLSGNIIVGATVQVKNHLTGINAPIYELDGTTPKANPMTSDSSGRYTCKIASGIYDVVATKSSYTVTDQEITIVEDATIAYLTNDSGGSMVVGTAAYIKGDGTVGKAVSDNTEEKASVEAICVESLLTNGSTGRFRVLGPIPGIAGTPGALGYLSATGTITETVPSGGAGDNFSAILGRWRSATVFSFRPSIPFGL